MRPGAHGAQPTYTATETNNAARDCARRRKNGVFFSQRSRSRLVTTLLSSRRRAAMEAGWFRFNRPLRAVLNACTHNEM